MYYGINYTDKQLLRAQVSVTQVVEQRRSQHLEAQKTRAFG